MLTKQKLSEKALIDILKEYDIGKVKKIKSVPTSGNITFLIDTVLGKYILRLCPKGDRWRSREEIAAELELIDYLKKHKFPAPCPIAKKTGEIIIEHKNKFGYLRKYNPGKATLKPNIKQVNEFGKTVGWFHSLIGDYKTKHKREHIWDLDTTKKYFLELKEAILKSNFPKADDFVAGLEKELSNLSFPNELPRGMIHEDLGKRHILWKNNKISCILDFDRCYYGKLILDLGQAIRGWCFTDNWQKWSNKNLEALLNGYFQKRKLTNLEKKYLFDAVKFGVLERGFAFCLRFIEATQDPEDSDFAHNMLNKAKSHLIN
jgi:homoserine kinase type II